MVRYHPPQNLPPIEELPDSDDRPVDNELQIIVPTLLRVILNWLWADRKDWFFGVNMGIFHTTGENPRVPIVPDALLSLGVEHTVQPFGRPSYIIWNENWIVPIFVLEYVSRTYGGEYDEKMETYARLGVLYYLIYNPQYHARDRHEPFELYRLVEGEYVRQEGEPCWMPEIGLGIGREVGIYVNWEREWLYWYDQNGQRLLSPEERLEEERERVERERQRTKLERQRAEQERDRAERLAEQLRCLGIEPE
ncbi:Uma2 family endonuclease [Lusitaniella coriacea LEGE 07157]|uniref:Uma2 family endonuclease n=1 Tax=Lusitaniella coriacea LEGE 07157 TaxID=945747 RepID=A0A8J7DLD7_9CYAN|nr:Uma2 family endonuclease [Lusitaniella coriacea]MBE9114848.1 Uma2 family endonuclease [Lusitaniella coriacea LEGE 07157]